MDLNDKIAYIDLSNRQIKTAPIPPEFARRFLGGRGVGSQLLFQQLAAQVDALSPDNTIVISVGLLEGMLSPGAAFTYVISKSPLTGELGVAAVAGFFGAELRRSGYDHLVITGKARRPALILIRDGKIGIQDASSVWGKGIPDTQEMLRKQFEDDDLQTLCIGPAGEKQVNIAGISTRYEAVRMQSGVGAVFGSKHLKAIVVRGSRAIPIENPTAALEYERNIVRGMLSTEVAHGLQDIGSAFLDNGGDDLFREQKVGIDSCLGCQLHCRRRFAIKRGAHAGTYGQIPGYPEERAWRELAGDRDPDELLYLSHLADVAGLDSLEIAAIAQRAGGSHDIAKLVSMLANGERTVDGLVEGAAGRSDDVVGALFNDSEARWRTLGLATANSGYDTMRFLPACDPHRLPEEALVGLVNRTSHLAGTTSSARETAPALVRWTQNFGMVLDILGICDLNTSLIEPGFPSLDEFSGMLKLNAGLDISPQELWEAADEAFSQERLFNLREGRQSGIERAGRAQSLDKTRFDSALKQYYELRGWDAEGTPTKATSS